MIYSYLSSNVTVRELNADRLIFGHDGEYIEVDRSEVVSVKWVPSIMTISTKSDDYVFNLCPMDTYNKVCSEWFNDD